MNDLRRLVAVADLYLTETRRGRIETYGYPGDRALVALLDGVKDYLGSNDGNPEQVSGLAT